MASLVRCWVKCIASAFRGTIGSRRAYSLAAPSSVFRIDGVTSSMVRASAGPAIEAAGRLHGFAGFAVAWREH